MNAGLSGSRKMRMALCIIQTGLLSTNLQGFSMNPASAENTALMQNGKLDTMEILVPQHTATSAEKSAKSEAVTARKDMSHQTEA